MTLTSQETVGEKQEAHMGALEGSRHRDLGNLDHDQEERQEILGTVNSVS
jgi:hypothetical protein